ncbi:unnamed protein product [Lathyrus sativus]|nr:unnamed protein product [Lathyrus sativus]
MIQLDLQNAYDVVNWNGLECVLKEIYVPNQFTNWIMAGITTVSYKFNINWELSNFLQDKRGITQGDPISPLLFVIVMKGDAISVDMTVGTFKRFSDSTGLVVNPSKCKIFFAGIDGNNKAIL